MTYPHDDSDLSTLIHTTTASMSFKIEKTAVSQEPELWTCTECGRDKPAPSFSHGKAPHGLTHPVCNACQLRLTVARRRKDRS